MPGFAMLRRLDRVYRLAAPSSGKINPSQSAFDQLIHRVRSFSTLLPDRKTQPSLLEKTRNRNQVSTKRNYTDVHLPPIMEDCPRVMWPGFIKGWKNTILTFFVMPNMDPDFDMREFLEGARQAVETISHKISRGEFDDLEGLVDRNALQEIKRNMANFNVAQREVLAVNKSDMFFGFPHEIGVIIPDNTNEKRRFVEIFTVFHVMKGLSRDRQEMAQKPFFEFVQDETTSKRMMVCNYRFFRDFSEGADPTWTVNLLNHWIPRK